MRTIAYVYIDRNSPWIRDTVIRKTTETDANSLDNAIKQTANAYRTKRQNQLEQKCKNSRSHKQYHNNADAWVKNISDRPLTEQQTRSLAKGLKYNTKDADKLDYVADLESALKNSGLTDKTKEHIRHKITTNLHNKRPVKLDTEEQRAIKDLQDDDEMIILPVTKDE
jgi:hypothetical protein